MPTELERSVAANNGPLVVAVANDKNTLNEQNLEQHTQQQQQQHLQQTNSVMDGDMSTSQTSTTSNGSSGTCNGGRKTVSLLFGFSSIFKAILFGFFFPLLFGIDNFFSKRGSFHGGYETH